MTVGSLVMEVPAGRKWFKYNPWMTGRTGLIVGETQRLNTSVYEVLFSDNTILIMSYNNLVELKHVKQG